MTAFWLKLIAKSKEIGKLIQAGEKDRAQQYKEETSHLKIQAKSLQDKLSDLVDSQTETLYNIPNIPNLKVPDGISAEDNLIVEEWGEMPSLCTRRRPTLGID